MTCAFAFEKPIKESENIIANSMKIIADLPEKITLIISH